MKGLTAAIVLLLVAAGCVTPRSLTPTPDPGPQPTIATAVTVHQAKIGATQDAPLPAEFAGAYSFATIATQAKGAEPSIGVTENGSVFVYGSATVLRSTDGGRTWQDVHESPDGQDFDPMLWVDPVTNRVLATHIHPERQCNTMAFSDDEGATWSNPDLVCVPTSTGTGEVDHQKLATGAYAGPQAEAGRNGPYKQLVTLCYNDRGTTRCAASMDGGIHFAQDTAVDGAPPPLGQVPVSGQLLGNCGGFNGRQRHGPDGTIYLPYGYKCGETRIAVSTDGGATWTRRDANEPQMEYDPAITVTPDGTVYLVYRGQDQKVYLLRSTDKFETTQGPFLVSPPLVVGSVFTTLASGSDGRIAVAYLGNSLSSAGPDKVPGGTPWNLYVTVSLDADSDRPTFVTAQVNPVDDPVQRGTICYFKPCTAGDRNLGDFNDLTVGRDGRPWVSYTDGCTSASCHKPDQENPNTSRDNELSVAWLDSGPSLYDDKPRLATPRGIATAGSPG